MRRSQASAIESPAPAAAPSTCATTGFGISCRMRETSMPRRRFAIFASNANGARPSAIDFTSPPTQNVPAAPFSRTARTSWSSAARRAASTSPRVMSGFSALRRSGRFMVMVSKPESSFWRTISFALMDGAFVVVVDCRKFDRCRRVGKGALAPCPPTLSLQRWARYALPTLRRPFLFFHQRTARSFQRLERFVAGDRRQQLVVIPARLRFRRLLDLEEIHVMHHAAVLADLAVLGEHVVDRGFLHDLDDGGGVGRSRGLHGFQIVRHRGVDAGLRRRRHALDALLEALGKR